MVVDGGTSSGRTLDDDLVVLSDCLVINTNSSDTG